MDHTYNANVLKIVVHENMIGGSSIVKAFPSERDMPGIEPGPLGWYTSA
jgi:hypothetical protein